jgi:hypothetical protein
MKANAPAVILTQFLNRLCIHNGGWKSSLFSGTELIISVIIRVGIGSGSRRAKMTHKSRKNLEISCFEVLDVLF